MNYKDVFQLANSKGYDSIICFPARYGGSAMLPHEVTNEAANLCELSLIQKWLRDTHNTHIESISSIDENGIVNKKYRVLMVYEADTIKFPGSKYSFRDFICTDLSTAITEALNKL